MIREDGDLTKVVTSKVTDMNNLFLNLNPNDNISITQSINSWDVSNVTNMSFMFFGSDLFFNEDISSWDVSSVINMEGMFSFSTTFNQDIGSWDVSNVTEMSRMFYSTVFNQDIGSWDVSNATSMSGMFGSVNEEGFASTSFNQDISSWDVNSVTDCEGFSEGTTAWTEPKPNFTNCLSGEESVWTGDVITFTKVDDADPTLATNQDRITDNVWITRDNAEGGQIYNLVSESASDKETSPLGTEWAEGDIANYASLTYTPFRTATVKPKDAVGKTFVVHLIQDNIYLSIKILSWSTNKAGGFSYERSIE